MALVRFLWLWLLLTGTQGVKDGDMRLANGNTAHEGRVEIFYRGQWGTVCDNLWDLMDASVVCRALGFHNASEALGGAAFGPGRGPIMLDEVQCTGSEPSLANCSSLGWLKSNCRHDRDAGVVCTNETRNPHTLDLSGELSAALGQIFDNQQGCDLSITVTSQGEEGLDLCAHTLILTANPEAQALWVAPGSNITMEVDANCVSVVPDFLRYLYSRKIEVSLESVRCLHQLAAAHRATQLQDFCGRLFAALLPEDSSFHVALDLYAYAQSTGDALLEELCVQFLAWNFGALTQAEAWPRVPFALLHALLPRSELAVPSELALLQAVDAWSQAQGASRREAEGLLQHVRFPMVPPEELFQLQFNLSLCRDHEALVQKKVLQALEFHTVPLQLLAQYRGLNLSDDAYKPRIYTSASWSASVTPSSVTTSFGTQQRSYWAKGYQNYDIRKNSYGYMNYPYKSFQTQVHPSFLFRATQVSWSVAYLPTVDSCWNYGLSCTSDELPLLGLTRSGYSDPTIGYDNRALTLCEGRVVADVMDFLGSKASVPDTPGTNTSRRASTYSCTAGSFRSFRVVIRPFYLTNSTGLD